MIDYEALSFESEQVDHEHTLFQALVNEGKHIRILSSIRPQFTFNEKQLRDAAAAEVMAKLQYNHENNLDDDESKSATKKRRTLDPDEKVKQSRDRNREHAKNTRLRKKAYVIKLKELVDQMSHQKDIEERERQVLGEKIHDTQVIRKNAARLFLTYYSTCITDLDKWRMILDEKVVFTLPITPYRSFPRNQLKSNNRLCIGIDAVIADACSLALMAETILIGREVGLNALIHGESSVLHFDGDETSGRGPAMGISHESILAAGEVVMCHFVLRSSPSPTIAEVVNEYDVSCVQHGMMQMRFNRQNKITNIEMMFDVMGFMQQLQKASEMPIDSLIIPNMVEMGTQSSQEVRACPNLSLSWLTSAQARAVLTNDDILSIYHLNDEWTHLTGLDLKDTFGKSFPEVFDSIDSLSKSAKYSSISQNFIGAIRECLERGLVCSRVISFRPHAASKETSFSLGYVRILPLGNDSDVTPTHVLVTLTLLAIDNSLVENVLARQATQHGPIVSCNSKKRDEQLAYLQAFEAEYQRQCQSFHNHYHVYQQSSQQQQQQQQQQSQSSGQPLSIGGSTQNPHSASLQLPYFNNMSSVAVGMSETKASGEMPYLTMYPPQPSNNDGYSGEVSSRIVLQPTNDPMKLQMPVAVPMAQTFPTRAIYGQSSVASPLTMSIAGSYLQNLQSAAPLSYPSTYPNQSQTHSNGNSSIPTHQHASI